MNLTARRREIMQRIADGEVLCEAGWGSGARYRWRDKAKRWDLCSFWSRVVNDHNHVRQGVIDKMEHGGLIERFKPHAGVPCYRLTGRGVNVLGRANFNESLLKSGHHWPGALPA